LAASSYALFRRAWDGNRLCPENYNAETGEPFDQPDTESFYSWGALMALLGTSLVMDIGPWRGFELINDGEAVFLGPLASPLGQVTVAIADDTLTLAKGRRRLLVTNMRGSISQLRFGEGSLSLVIPAGVGDGAFLHLPEIAAENVRKVLLDGRETDYAEQEGGIVLANLSGHRSAVRLELYSRPCGESRH
jgi:putative isomerase